MRDRRRETCYVLSFSTFKTTTTTTQECSLACVLTKLIIWRTRYKFPHEKWRLIGSYRLRIGGRLDLIIWNIFNDFATNSGALFTFVYSGINQNRSSLNFGCFSWGSYYNYPITSVDCTRMSRWQFTSTPKDTSIETHKGLPRNNPMTTVLSNNSYIF